MIFKDLNSGILEAQIYQTLLIYKKKRNLNGKLPKISSVKTLLVFLISLKLHRSLVIANIELDMSKIENKTK